jgi:hypothetical protein
MDVCVSGNIVASETEEEIFKILGSFYANLCMLGSIADVGTGVPWQEPHERVRG